jgi:hypothetical protein
LRRITIVLLLLSRFGGSGDPTKAYTEEPWQSKPLNSNVNNTQVARKQQGSHAKLGMENREIKGIHDNRVSENKAFRSLSLFPATCWQTLYVFSFLHFYSR